MGCYGRLMFLYVSIACISPWPWQPTQVSYWNIPASVNYKKKNNIRMNSIGKCQRNARMNSKVKIREFYLNKNNKNATTKYPPLHQYCNKTMPDTIICIHNHTHTHFLRSQRNPNTCTYMLKRENEREQCTYEVPSMRYIFMKLLNIDLQQFINL